MGRAMLEACEDYARAKGGQRMRMTVISVRDTLIAWYQRRGYQLTGETLPFPYGDERVGQPQRDDLAFVVLAGAPVPEVMSRRTSENEDDPAWSESPALRLVDGLAALAPLEALTVETRPVLVLQGAADATFGAAHLEGWRAALLATGRAADAAEVAFVDGFFRPALRDEPALARESGLALLRDAVAAWAARAVSAAPARPAR
jgi:hypothetical protein